MPWWLVLFEAIINGIQWFILLIPVVGVLFKPFFDFLKSIGSEGPEVLPFESQVMPLVEDPRFLDKEK